MAGLVLKLFKSAKIIKVLFAAGSLALIAGCFLVWGLHLPWIILIWVFLAIWSYKAMIVLWFENKVIYLIPFCGSLALSDDKN